MKFGGVLVAVILSISLTSGNVLHAVVPHSHGSNHDHTHDSESPMWTDLHSALNHEDKKILLAIAALFPLVAVAVLSRNATFRISAQHLSRATWFSHTLDPNAGILLRRGIHPYRAFG